MIKFDLFISSSNFAFSNPSKKSFHNAPFKIQDFKNSRNFILNVWSQPTNKRSIAIQQSRAFEEIYHDIETQDKLTNNEFSAISSSLISKATTILNTNSSNSVEIYPLNIKKMMNAYSFEGETIFSKYNDSGVVSGSAGKVGVYSSSKYQLLLFACVSKVAVLFPVVAYFFPFLQFNSLPYLYFK